MSKWEAIFINNPDKDFNLDVEILYDDKDVAIITQDNNNLTFKCYSTDKDIIIPFDWLFDLMSKAYDTIKVNNAILKNGKVIWKISESLLNILYDGIKEKIRETPPNETLFEFMKKLDQQINIGASPIIIDIGHIFKTSKDIQEFNSIIHECINECSKKFNWPDEIKKYIYQVCLKMENS